MSRYPRYPPASATAPQQLRNPWISDQLEVRESQSTNSSSSSRTYPRGPGPPPTVWLRGGHHIDALVEAPPPVNPLIPVVARTHSRAASDRERPVTPASSPGAGSGGAVDGCGGHCVAFENFCYYCLQVVFIAGILTGVSLTIAGGVLRGQTKGGGDLLVLVYIGCMIAMVCTLLLSVQCCVRRNVKRRKRALRAAREARGRDRRSGQGPDMIPLQDMNQYQPLLVHLVQQQHQQTVITSQDAADQRHSHHHPHPANKYRPTMAENQADVSRSGTPWWRRNGPGVAESRH